MDTPIERRLLRLRRRSVLLRITAIFLFMVCMSSTASEYAFHVGPNGYAPYVIVERTDSRILYYGFVFDFLDAFEAANPEFKRKNALLTRKRANVKMASGQDIDLMFNSPLFVSDEILQFYRFTDSLFVTRDVVISHKSSQLEYNSPLDLYGKTVGTIRGYSYGKFDKLIKRGEIIDMRVDHHTQAIGMLEKGRIDAYFGNIFVSPHYIKQLGFNVSDYNIWTIPMYEFEFAFAVNNKKPELYKKLNEFIAVAKSDGSMDELIKKYIQ